MTRTSPSPLSPFHTSVHAMVRARSLMSYPTSPPEEVQGVAYLEALLPQLTGPVRLRHPFVDLEMELSPQIGARLFYLASVGEYELSDLELLQRHVRRGDVVMEVGGGIGLTAAMSARMSGRPVLMVEPDERLFPMIRRQVELNNGEIRFERGVVGATKGQAEVEFFLDEEVWFSSLRPAVEAHGEHKRVPVRVPHLSLPELFARHQPTVAMIDIEGAEDGLFEGEYSHLPAMLLLEIHFPILGEQRGAGVVQAIVDQGYRLVDCYGWTFVFKCKGH